MNFLLNHVIEDKIEGEYKEEGVSSYRMTLGKGKIYELERESTRSYSEENWLWERL
jgi:hypothetical protein